MFSVSWAAAWRAAWSCSALCCRLPPTQSPPCPWWRGISGHVEDSEDDAGHSARLLHLLGPVLQCPAVGRLGPRPTSEWCARTQIKQIHTFNLKNKLVVQFSVKICPYLFSKFHIRVFFMHPLIPTSFLFLSNMLQYFALTKSSQ